MKVLGLSRAEGAEQARLLLDRFGLAEKRGDYPDRLSAGQQQLLSEPADERTRRFLRRIVDAGRL